MMYELVEYYTEMQREMAETNFIKLLGFFIRQNFAYARIDCERNGDVKRVTVTFYSFDKKGKIVECTIQDVPEEWGLEIKIACSKKEYLDRIRPDVEAILNVLYGDKSRR